MLKQMRCVSIVALLATAGGALAGGTVIPSDWSRADGWGGDGSNPVSYGGEPVWHYEVVTDPQAGQLGSTRPWYMQPRSSMVYDFDWFNTGQSAYAQGDDVNPPIFNTNLVHNVFVNDFSNIPVVRWRKPSFETRPSVFVQGQLRLLWDGLGGVGVPNDVDVVIAKVNGSNGTMTTLFSQTVASAISSPTVGGSAVIPVNLSVTMATGDSILYTLRGRQGQSPSGSWVRMFDDGLTITTVPTPGVASVLGLAGLAAIRRRRA
jgi:MYXO-CTERM domain-containing protein